MPLRLKPLNQQVIVITGATSGIGLATAREAARRGARLVLAARNVQALEALIDEMRGMGAQAIAIPADVASEHDVRRIGEAADDAFGRVDSWVNNAAVAMFGEIPEMSLEDQRRLFDIDFWGVVHGCREALRRIKGPGAIINIGSVLSDVPMPLQSAYTAAKHAVKGYTDTLRIEADKAGRPISVTLIKPAAIDTPYAEHARTYRDRAPATPPPHYPPEQVAAAILKACEHPVREQTVGAAATLMKGLHRAAPAAFDWYARSFLYDQQEQDASAKGPRGMRDNLYRPQRDLETYSPTQQRSSAGQEQVSDFYSPNGSGRGFPLQAALLGALALGIGVAAAAQRAGGERGSGAGDARQGQAQWPDIQSWSPTRSAPATEPRWSASIES